MLTMMLLSGVALWMLERLAFAILLLWGWGAIASLAAETEAALLDLWADRPQFIRVVL